MAPQDVPVVNDPAQSATRPRTRTAEWRELCGRAWSGGVADLVTPDLLRILCGPGSAASGRALTLRCDLVRCSRSPPEELAGALAGDRAGAVRLAAAFELGRRLERARMSERPAVRGAADVFELCRADLTGLEREHFRVLVLDGKHRLALAETVSVGSLTSSIVHPREVFRPAIRASAAAIVCLHNHPSGDPEPSPEDLEVTRRLRQAGRTLGIPLLDHVVVGDGRYVSLRERLGW